MHQQRNHCDLGCCFPAMLAIRLAISWNSSLQCAHDLSNVNTWAMFFLRYVLHGPLLSIYWLWLCPHLGARIRSHAIRRRLFIVLMTAAHISPNVFSLRMFLSTYRDYFLQYTKMSLTLIIHHIHTHIYIFYFIRLIHIFTSSDLHGRLAVLGSLYPIHVL